MSHQKKSTGLLWKAILSKGKYLLTLAASLIAAILFTVMANRTNTLDEFYGNTLDPIISIGTILLAILIWFDVIRKEYQQNLPKRLSVLYKIKVKENATTIEKEHPIMYYHKAFLSGEDDIRPWAQQLIYQANDRVGLLFTAFFNMLHETPDVETIRTHGISQKQPIMLYLLEMHLTGGYKTEDIPERLRKQDPIVLEKRFQKHGKNMMNDTLIFLTLDGGRTETEVFKTDLAKPNINIPKPLQTEILDALQH